MAFTYPDMIRPKLRRLLWAATTGPTGEYMRAAVFGVFAVFGLALLLPGIDAASVMITAAFFVVASAMGGWRLYRSYPHGRLGLCNHLTLIRLVIVCALIAPLIAGAAPSWSFFWMAAVCLALDGIDGWLARRQGLVSDFGARFDVEVDSLLALVLALSAAVSTDVGLAAILLGLPRYAFMAASLGLPWMRCPLPERFSRKAVCVVQLGVLIALQAPILPAAAGGMLGAVAVLLLVWSFAIDILWLWRRRA